MAPKCQHPTTLQRVLNNTYRCLIIHAPNVATSGLLNLTLALGFFLYQQDGLGMGLHKFGLGQYTYSTWKALKACNDQHQVIVGNRNTHSLDEAAKLAAPVGVSLHYTLAMERSIPHTTEGGTGHLVWTGRPHRAGHEGCQ